MLGAMFSGRHALIQDKNGAYFIDRDGRHFHEILNFLRGSAVCTEKLMLQRHSSEALEELKVEADFYGLKNIMFPTVSRKKFVSSKQKFEPTVSLNVGGQLFTTTVTTLTHYPDTMLRAMFSWRQSYSFPG